MKFELFRLSSKFIRPKSETLMILIGFIVAGMIISCSSSEQSSISYLPTELEDTVQEEAMQFFTTTGFEPLRLDTVTELTINDIRHPTSAPHVHSRLGGRELWCFTTVARGTVAGISHEVSHSWFGLEEEEGWVIIPRHIVAYAAFWDDACDQAERLDS